MPAERNPHPEWPVLLVVSDHLQAARLQRVLHRDEFLCVPVGASLAGIRVRAIMISIGSWEDRVRNLPPEAQQYESNRCRAWLELIRCRLGPACDNQFMWL